MHECQCLAGSICERYKRWVGQRMISICKGEVLTQQKCAAYRQRWDAEAGSAILNPKEVKTPPVPASPQQFPCIYREELLEEVPCQLCGQKDQKAKG